MTGDWQRANRVAVQERLQWLLAAPDGVLYDRKSQVHRIVVRKDGGIVRMYFVDPHSNSPNAQTSGPMSSVRPSDPLDLSPTAYNQAMMLCLLWAPRPARVYMVGFAGGRLALLLHHCFPSVVIESTDIDSEVVAVAEHYFAIRRDERQQVHIEDGRQYLARCDHGKLFDIILLDAFRGTGYSPFHLATLDFFTLCKSHLSPGGVVALNLIKTDPLYQQKLDTLAACFPTVYLQEDRTTVIFGTTAAPFTPAQIEERAGRLQELHRFGFPFAERARTLERYAPAASAPTGQASARVLTDQVLPGPIKDCLPPTDAIFFKVSRNDLCPCGSGHKFKNCHGAKSEP